MASISFTLFCFKNSRNLLYINSVPFLPGSSSGTSFSDCSARSKSSITGRIPVNTVSPPDLIRSTFPSWCACGNYRTRPVILNAYQKFNKFLFKFLKLIFYVLFSFFFFLSSCFSSSEYLSVLQFFLLPFRYCRAYAIPAAPFLVPLIIWFLFHLIF
jgi:hypothetical protein